MKRCSKCGEIKDLDVFGSMPSASDGRHAWCKPCLNIAGKKYRDINREKVRASSAKWRREHKQEQWDMTRDWRSRNPDRYRATMRRWRQRHPQESSEYAKRWEKANPVEYAASRKVIEHRRRTRKSMSCGSGVSASEWRSVLSDFNGACAYCMQPIAIPEMEHMDPIARGGWHDPSNVVPACRSCNRRKGTQTALEFMTGFRLDLACGES